MSAKRCRVRSSLRRRSQEGERRENHETNGASSAADEIRGIDSMLHHRNPSPSDGVPPATRGTLLSNPGPVGHSMAMSESERVWAHVDMYGRLPPEKEALEEKIRLIEAEVAGMPEDEVRSLSAAIRHNPLLLQTSSHVKMILQDKSYGDFDATRVTKRLVQYWRLREDMFGPGAFAAGTVSAPDYYDHIRHYERSEKVLSDPDSDEIAKAVAGDYIRSVHWMKLAALDSIIEKTPQLQKVEYLDALRRCPEIAASDNHKLQFLLCEEFVEGAAARRMLRYWKTKYDLFGPEMAGRSVTMSDLEDHGKHLEQGIVRLMLETDAHGRPIVVVFMREYECTPKCYAQSIWYIMHSAMDEHSCQRKGVVMLIDCRRIGRESRAIALRDGSQVGREAMIYAAPFKLRAIHVRFDYANWWQRAFAKMSTWGSILFSRFIAHYGTDDEMWRDLETFGISADKVPTELGGEVPIESLTQWVEERRRAGK